MRKLEKFEQPLTTMVIIAHPDDLEAFCGGAIAKLSKIKSDIIVVVCTNADMGLKDKSKAKMMENRRIQEQYNAGKILGYEKIIYLNYPDGKLETTSELINQLKNLYYQYQPQIIFTFDFLHPIPTLLNYWRFIPHHDHITTGQATMLSTKEVDVLISNIYLFATTSPNVGVDISEYMSLKLKALGEHKSQFGGMILSLGIKTIFWLFACWEGFKSKVKYAESFRKVAIVKGSNLECRI